MVDRLYKDANNRIEKEMQHQEAFNEYLSKIYPFRPQLSHDGINNNISSHSIAANHKEFYDRQQTFLQK